MHCSRLNEIYYHHYLLLLPPPYFEQVGGFSSHNELSAAAGAAARAAREGVDGDVHELFNDGIYGGDVAGDGSSESDAEAEGAATSSNDAAPRTRVKLRRWRFGRGANISKPPTGADNEAYMPSTPEGYEPDPASDFACLRQAPGAELTVREFLQENVEGFDDPDRLEPDPEADKKLLGQLAQVDQLSAIVGHTERGYLSLSDSSSVHERVLAALLDAVGEGSQIPVPHTMLTKGQRSRCEPFEEPPGDESVELLSLYRPSSNIVWVAASPTPEFARKARRYMARHGQHKTKFLRVEGAQEAFATAPCLESTTVVARALCVAAGIALCEGGCLLCEGGASAESQCGIGSAAYAADKDKLAVFVIAHGQQQHWADFLRTTLGALSTKRRSSVPWWHLRQCADITFSIPCAGRLVVSKLNDEPPAYTCKAGIFPGHCDEDGYGTLYKKGGVSLQKDVGIAVLKGYCNFRHAIQQQPMGVPSRFQPKQMAKFRKLVVKLRRLSAMLNPAPTDTRGKENLDDLEASLAWRVEASSSGHQTVQDLKNLKDWLCDNVVTLLGSDVDLKMIQLPTVAKLVGDSMADLERVAAVGTARAAPLPEQTQALATTLSLLGVSGGWATLCAYTGVKVATGHRGLETGGEEDEPFPGAWGLGSSAAARLAHKQLLMTKLREAMPDECFVVSSHGWAWKEASTGARAKMNPRDLPRVYGLAASKEEALEMLYRQFGGAAYRAALHVCRVGTCVDESGEYWNPLHGHAQLPDRRVSIWETRYPVIGPPTVHLVDLSTPVPDRRMPLEEVAAQARTKCVAIATSTQRRCTKWAAPGSTHCNTHAPAVPNVSAAVVGDALLLLHAARGDHAEISRLVGNGADVDAVDPSDGATALHDAVERGDVQTVAMLVHMRADVNIAMPSTATPLAIAVEGGHEAIARKLIRCNADVNACCDFTFEGDDHSGASPLHVGAIHGDVAVVRALLDGGASVGSLAGDDGTPLHCACAYGETDVAELLLSNRADPTVRDVGGNTPMELALLQDHAELASTVRKHCGAAGVAEQVRGDVVATPEPVAVAAALDGENSVWGGGGGVNIGECAGNLSDDDSSVDDEVGASDEACDGDGREQMTNDEAMLAIFGDEKGVEGGSGSGDESDHSSYTADPAELANADFSDASSDGAGGVACGKRRLGSHAGRRSKRGKAAALGIGRCSWPECPAKPAKLTECYVCGAATHRHPCWAHSFQAPRGQRWALNQSFGAKGQPRGQKRTFCHACSVFYHPKYLFVADKAKAAEPASRPSLETAAAAHTRLMPPQPSPPPP